MSLMGVEGGGLNRIYSWPRLLMSALFLLDGTPWLPRTIMLFFWDCECGCLHCETVSGGDKTAEST